MTTSSHPLSPRRWVVPARRVLAPALTLVALVLGGIWGYDFGHQVSGALFGWLTGALGALFCSLLADAALQRLRR